MSWKDRISGSMTLISPDGTTFEARWAGDARTVEKKVGVFTFPNVKGAEVQDLDVGGAQYPLTIYFEGDSHDLAGISFNNACTENGLWSVDHPVYGFIELQLLSWTEHAQPVTSANITKFDIEFVEPSQEDTSVTPQSLASSVDEQATAVNADAVEQFEQVTQDSFSEVSAIAETAEQVVAVVEETLATLYEANDAINARVTSIKAGIQDTIIQPIIDTTSLAGQLQNMIQLPALAVEDTATRLNAYSNCGEALKNIDVGL